MASVRGRRVYEEDDDPIPVATIMGYSRGYIPGISAYSGRRNYETAEVTGVELRDNVTINIQEDRTLNKCRVTRVVSPFEFYVRKYDVNDYESDFEFLQNEMQKFYEEMEDVSRELIIRLSMMRCYAYYDPETKRWSRVRIHALKSDEEDVALAYFCDFGKQEYIECKQLRQLLSAFLGTRTTPLLKCYLYDVMPSAGGFVWSWEAVSYFKELFEGRNGLHEIAVTHYSSSKVLDNSPQLVNHCGVVMILEESKSMTKDVTLNYLMVEKGFAKSTGIMSASQKVLNIPGFAPRFEHVRLVRTPKKIEEPAESKYEGGIPDEVYKDIVRRNTAPFNNFPIGSTITNNYKKPSVVTEKPNYLPIKIRKRIGRFWFENVEGPGNMFVRMQNEYTECSLMESKLWIQGKRLEKPKLEEMKLGQFISCESKKKSEENSMRRAFVLKIALDDPRGVKVFLVDYGRVIWVAEKLIYNLPARFQFYPSFVHRVHLATIRPNFGVTTWEPSVSDVFAGYVMSFDNDQSIYVLEVLEKKVVELTKFNDRLLFDEEKHDWIVDSKPRMVKDLSAKEVNLLNLMKDHPLFKTHFYSFGIDVRYENVVKKSEFFRFPYLSEFLLIKEHAVFIKKPVDKQRIHETITNGYL